jgi:NADH-quinone oxidoreductase subunit C
LPDATGLELIAQRVRDTVGEETVTGTVFFREQPTLEVAPGAVHDVLAYLRSEDEEPWEQLMSLHACDYLPDAPRLGIHYQLLSMERTDRLNVKTRVGIEEPRVGSVVDLYPTAEFHEREVYDMFGVRFRNHPDLARILMPLDWEGHPLRRDYPLGGEEVEFSDAV